MKTSTPTLITDKNMNIEQNNIFHDIYHLSMAKKLNILIGSGASIPAIPLLKDINIKDECERNNTLLKKIQCVSGELINGSYSEETIAVLNQYKKNVGEYYVYFGLYFILQNSEFRSR